MKTISIQIAVIAALLSGGFALKMSAAPIGDVVVVYNANNTFGIPILDGPAFVIQNFSATNMANVVLTIGIGGDNTIADSFNVGTITAGSFVIVEPGASNDGGVHAPGSFFTFTGSILDSSDFGPDQNTVPFDLTGLLGATPITTGTFTPAATYGTSVDGTTTVNFLGLGDPPCNDCFNKEVAVIGVASTVPDQGSTFGLLFLSLIALLSGTRLRSTR